VTGEVKHDWVCPEHDRDIWGCEGEACCCKDRHYPRKGFWARLWVRLPKTSTG
jgi:hypothetical protein